MENDDRPKSPGLIDVYIVDAFADIALTGNPAGVCPLPDWLPDPLMQAVASELKQSETAFYVPEGRDFRIRWFTPTREVDHIGHATLAAGHIVLGQTHYDRGEVRFLTGADFMSVTRRSEGSAALDMSAIACSPAPVTDAVTHALRARPREAHAGKHHLFVFDDPSEVARLDPDMVALANLPLPGTIVTAPGGNGVDFVSRFFAPANGVPEDPVSGVSHCCLTPFWAERLGRTALVGQQLSSRGGRVACELRGNRVTLGGRAVTTLWGKLQLP